jgi:RHS repeat-associated protein
MRWWIAAILLWVGIGFQVEAMASTLVAAATPVETAPLAHAPTPEAEPCSGLIPADSAHPSHANITVIHFRLAGYEVQILCIRGFSNYAGEEFVPHLGQYYNRARYLDVERGRFWSQDDFEGYDAIPSSMHLYSYGFADPINRLDPSGHSPLVVAVAIVVAVHILIAVALHFSLSGSSSDQPSGVGYDPTSNSTDPSPFSMRIVATAKSYIGSTDWHYNNWNYEHIPFQVGGQNKCNLFVYDVMEEASVYMPRITPHPYRWKKFPLLMAPPLAKDFGNPQLYLPGWAVVSSPQPGDLAAMGGHVAIVSDTPNRTISHSSNEQKVVHNDWGFRPTEPTPVYRRRIPGF